MKDSLWSLDLFRCESATLGTHWGLVVMDQFTRRIVGLVFTAAWQYGHARQYDLAIEHARRTIAMEPGIAIGHTRLGEAYLGKRMFPEAIQTFQTASKASGEPSNALGPLGYAYALSGQKAEARKLIPRLKELAREAGGHSSLAKVYAGLGETRRR